MTDTIKIDNALGIDVVVYDSYTSDQDENYFGALTPLGTVPGGSSLTITPIHAPVCVLIAMDRNGKPVGRYVSLFSKKDIGITQADLDHMGFATRFVDAITQAPDSDLAKQFHAVIYDTSGTVQVEAVNSFFKAHADYQSVTFQAYMLALTYRARNPGGHSTAPVEKQPYSLSALCTYLGGTWPAGFPDILVTDFSCGTKADTLFLSGRLTLSGLPFESSAIAQHVLSLVPLDTVTVEFSFHYGFDLGIFGTSIKFIADDFRIPAGGVTVVIEKPTVSLDISPIFKFVVFKAYATIPFDLFDKKFDAKISMVVDNVEAEIGVVIDGDHASLPFPAIPELHLDEFGVGLGVIFEPPSVAVGIQGKCHLGSGNNIVALDDDTFVLVCAFEEEPEGIPVPNPLYLSFRVPKLDLPALIELFTGRDIDPGLPISLEDLSLQWAENPMEPVTLPDGSLTQAAFGCSCYLHLLSFEFYGTFDISFQGVHGTLAMSPLQWGTAFSLTGKSQGVSLKVDEQGNLIKNNQLPKTKAEKEAIEKAQTKQIVPPGGPLLAISTSASPYLTLSLSAALLGEIHEEIEASIANDGISFYLDFGAVLQGKMRCVLKDFHNLSADFSYGFNLNVPLPTVAGFALGVLPVTALCAAGLTITTSTTDIVLQVRGSFQFAGMQLGFGPYREDVNISGVTALIEATGRQLIADAENVFAPFFRDAGRWASSVRDQLIRGVGNVAQGLRQVFGQSEQDAASIMKSVGYDINEVAGAISNAFGANANQIAPILGIVFGVPPQQIAGALRAVGFGAEAVAAALNSAFGLPPDAVNVILQGAGFNVNEINDAFNAIGGAFAQFAQNLWSHLDPRKW